MTWLLLGVLCIVGKPGEEPNAECAATCMAQHQVRQHECDTTHDDAIAECDVKYGAPEQAAQWLECFDAALEQWLACDAHADRLLQQCFADCDTAPAK